ncbi:condensation domain-containing protein, partial [uncultured Aquimarina sp.]|uniref:non-ribosomal peptide synthetase n=1 Tax=uncultured Aquimarina sp. TaxID=575652 RepID=UPI00260B102D
MINFLKKISENDIYLDIVDGELKLFSENENIDKELLHEIKEKKVDIISFLKENKGFNSGTSKDIPKVNLDNNYTLSDAQKRLWILSQLEEGSMAYNMPNSIELNGSYDLDSFEKAIISVIDRHEILRTVFKEDDKNEVKQWIIPVKEFDFKIQYNDYREKENPSESVLRYIQEDSYKPFDLEKGPLLRASLLQTSDDTYVFYYNLHHIISDGWSKGILTKDILSFYEVYKSGLRPNLPELEIQYKDYAAWQVNQLDTNEYKEHQSYWLNNLSGELPLLNFPSAKKRPQLKTFNGQSLSTYISSDVTGGFNTYCQEQGGSLFMGLLAVWNILCYKYTAQKDIIIGTPAAGRNHSSLEDQIGFYINTLALRNQIDPEENFDTFYRKVKDNTLRSYGHQEYPFDRLVNDLGGKNDRSRSAIFDVMLALQNSSESVIDIELQKDKINTIESTGAVASKFDLEVLFQEVNDHLFLKVNYNTDVYEGDMVEGLMSHFKELLSSLLVSPDLPINKINYLTALERLELLSGFNDTQIDYPRDCSIVDLFVAQALETPDSIAILFEDQQLTYRELDDMSNQLAHYLLSNYDINRDDFIGVKLERSEWLLISLLGILKSGGAYVPIDPTYPQERISYIESDSNCKVTIDDSILEIFSNTISDYSNELPEVSISATDLAYVMYTSGSTGKPKGVMVEHRNIIRLVQSNTFYNFSTSDILLSTG